MSLSKIKPYFRTRLDSLGYREWKDGFNFENIPETLLDKSYHIQIENINSLSQTMNDVSLEADVRLRVFKKGFRYVTDALDDAYSEIDCIILEILKPDLRLSNSGGFKNIIITSSAIEEGSIDNDNFLLINLSFRAIVYLPILRSNQT